MIYYTFHFSKRKENIMNKKYSDRTKKKVIEQYLAGVSVSDLVSKFNVSRTTVYTWTRDHKKKQKHEAVDMKKHFFFVYCGSIFDHMLSHFCNRNIRNRRK